MQRGIKVVSWDSGVAKAGRQIHLNPSNNALIGETNVKLAVDALKALNVEKGDVAILSATPTSTNQNIWIEEMKKVLPKYPSVNLVTVAYGDDLSDKSYREAVGLLKSYPDLKVIVSPSSVGIVAAAQAVKDQGKIGKVYVTGLGLPSEMAGAVKSGRQKLRYLEPDRSGLCRYLSGRRSSERDSDENRGQYGQARQSEAGC
jgi:rhamnose transport system substrate-binding protein